MADIDVSKEGRIKQARKLTKLGLKPDNALRIVNNMTVDRLYGEKTDAEKFSNYLKDHAKITDKTKTANVRAINDWSKEETYTPFKNLIDNETEKKILTGKGNVNKHTLNVEGVAKARKAAGWTSTTTGKTFESKEAIYKKENTTLDKTFNKKVRFAGLTNIPTLWHPETNCSQASNGGSCAISALTALDWEKKYGKKPVNLNENQLKEFAEMSKIHQKTEYEEQLNNSNIDSNKRYNDNVKKHSGLSGSIPVTRSHHLSKRFTHNMDPVKAMTALSDNRTYFGERTGHGYTLSKEGNKYTVGTTASWGWPKSGKMFTKMTGSRLHVDPSVLSAKDNQIFEFLKKKDWDIWENNPTVNPRKDKSKFPKQVPISGTKARN